ncbi:hypothetical protein [Pelagibius sp. Alg239-R121]|uniref:hypothetical protein n=1 Tax=Pelagibius sp. Alg239-R121 TaxID=2993448 RepID=UPI0024A6A1C9|nr:hypothetical protein [Pelagibius sp. Alg239-R121]
MSIEPNIISFPTPGIPGDEYDYWLSWVECELAILGYDLPELSYDWKSAYERKMKPEEAATAAVAAVDQNA